MKKTLSIVLFVLLVFLAVACSPEHTHDYKLVPEKSLEATCTANGYNYMQCSCGAIQSIPTAVLGHDYVVDEERSSASTCIKKGNSYKVCSRCEDIKNVDLPLDPANHPFFYNSGTADTPDYVGVYESWKDFTTVPTCAKDGEGVFTECTACGKTGEFKVTVSSSEFIKYYTTETYGLGKDCAHVKVNKEGNGVEDLTADDIEEWKTIETATAFVNGSETAYCPTCRKLITDDGETNTLVEKVVPFEKDDVLGLWTLKLAEDSADKNFNTYYFTVYKKNGSYLVDGYRVNLSDKKVYSVTSQTGMVATWDEEAETNDSNVDYNSTNISFSSTNAGNDLGEATTFVLTECGKETSVGLSKTAKVHDKLMKVGASYYVVSDAVEHKHNFTLMNDARAIALSGSKNGHYVECKDCGLKYVFEEHASGCEICGWTNNWYKVTIGKWNTSDSAAPETTNEFETYFVEKKPSINISENGKYEYFLGYATEYTSTVAITSSPSIETTKTGTVFTLTGTTGNCTAIAIALKKN